MFEDIGSCNSLKEKKMKFSRHNLQRKVEKIGFLSSTEGKTETETGWLSSICKVVL